MITIRSIADIARARLPTSLTVTVTRNMTHILNTHTAYNPDEDGHLSIVTPNDTDKILCQRLGWKWSDNCFESATRSIDPRLFTITILRNNQFVETLLIPDEPWLDPAIRQRLMPFV